MREKVLAPALDRHTLPMGEERKTVLNTPSPQQAGLPFYTLLPRHDPVAMLRWKIYVRKRCLHDLEFRTLIVQMCKQDICFFAATFCWVFEPRPPRHIPLTPWCDQADVLAWMQECYQTHRDCGIEKTRGIGLSWDWAILCEWLFLFVPECKIGMSSKDEQVLDGPDSNSLMGKIDYLHARMPAWLRGRPRRPSDIGCMRRTFQNHLRVNLETGATIQGFASTDSKLRSLRFSVFGYDEFAYFPRDAQESLNASQYTAPVRFFISTWHGPDNAFHEIMRLNKSTLLRVSTYWWDNADRWKGCYTTENGRLKIIDTSYKFPADYPFVLDGLKRSPWVDYELNRAGSRVQSALEELYGLAAEGGRKLLRLSTIHMAEDSVRTPFAEGDIDTAGAVTVFRRGEGLLRIWQELGNGKGGPFALGCDLAKGLGASYSTLEGLSLATGEQVIEFADNMIDPVTFAGYTVAVCRWLAGDKGDGYVYLTFENNGDQGTVFGRELMRLGYGNILKRKYAGKVPKTQADKYLGMRNTDGGLGVLAELERAIRDGEFVPRSAELVKELHLFDKDENGKPVFPRGYEGHGDRAHGMGMAWELARERMVEKDEAQIASRENAYAELEAPEVVGQWSDAWTLEVE